MLPSIFLRTHLKLLQNFLYDGNGLCSPPALTLKLILDNAQSWKKIIINDFESDDQIKKFPGKLPRLKIKNLLLCPVVDSDGSILGVTEMVNKKDGGFTNSDYHIVQSFTSISSMSLEHSQLQEAAQLGKSQKEASQWIKSNERETFLIPLKLQFSLEQKKKIFQINFFTLEHHGIDLIKIFFYVF